MNGTLPPALRLDSVDAGYGQRLVISNASLTVPAGARVCLIGSNGSGKSTMFRVCLGLLVPWRGAVELFGVPARRLDRRRQPVAYVPQARQMDMDFPVSAHDVVMMGRVGRRGPFRWPDASDRQAADSALREVGLSQKADRSFGALSGGEQQRVLLARAIASEAQLFFLDEPATGMDIVTRTQVDLLLDELAASGRAVVVSTHDLTAEHLARFDWLVGLNGGQIVGQGSPAEVMDPQIWRRIFEASEPPK